ncbi:hypothetical protein M427DRAFT_427333 [Gonapodya prolifera JEL478]|uniref:Uncharacterized protein n=1 Tax=Gonapodya prolifera (strain JEL478) TaxID=1344416 RepID=A0A139ASF2_GONPJ|nr:hypothetical protein M427DRAFT_427333 [Gonapodya prolifera JEL478]|eukprot:KXS19672.1 hypothetical protein M427DRAFT_427333 [Gonapodya prolifera JEL478]
MILWPVAAVGSLPETLKHVFLSCRQRNTKLPIFRMMPSFRQCFRDNFAHYARHVRSAPGNCSGHTPIRTTAAHYDHTQRCAYLSDSAHALWCPQTPCGGGLGMAELKGYPRSCDSSLLPWARSPLSSSPFPLQSLLRYLKAFAGRDLKDGGGLPLFCCEGGVRGAGAVAGRLLFLSNVFFKRLFCSMSQ